MDEGVRDQYRHERKDFIDRKTGFIERMFDKLIFAAQRDVKVTFIVLLVFTNIATFYLYTSSLENRVVENQEYSDRIIEEATRRLRPEIDREVDKKTQEIERKVDNASNTLQEIKDEVTKTIQENLQ